jgi:hypothetical protein
VEKAAGPSRFTTAVYLVRREFVVADKECAVIDHHDDCTETRYAPRLSGQAHQCTCGDRFFRHRSSTAGPHRADGTMASGASAISAMYAAARAIPLAVAVVVAVLSRSPVALLILGTLAGTVQGLDARCG